MKAEIYSHRKITKKIKRSPGAYGFKAARTLSDLVILTRFNFSLSLGQFYEPRFRCHNVFWEKKKVTSKNYKVKVMPRSRSHHEKHPKQCCGASDWEFLARKYLW